MAWLLLAAFVGWRMWPQLAAAIGVGPAGAAAPDVRLVTLAGDSLSLADLRGQVVLVNFWATWCPPCRVEMPGFQRVYEARRERGFTILGLSVDAAGRAPVARFLAEHGITYPVAMANTSAIQGFGRATLLPTSYLIDRRGRIRHEVRGYFTEVALAQAVERLLAEPAAGGAPAPVAAGDTP
ncbi:MAG TPA: TlpA disulfide reductase family protein [Gemmatimonadales bacterium]|nr:TlpA disulfide reductase family protein [Gemmatimonadales bacterium]